MRDRCSQDESRCGVGVEAAYIGIDLAFAKQKRLPISICTWQDRKLVPALLRQLPLEPPRGSGNAATLNEQTVTGFVEAAASYIRSACDLLSLSPRRIAIDAPSAPRQSGLRRRAAEAAMDKAGFSCFTTPTESEFAQIRQKVRMHLDSGGAENRIPHANQLWMLIGFRLFQRLNEIAPCLEVYPQATARVLGTGLIHKSSAGGVEAQLAAVARFTGWPTEGEPHSELAQIGYGPGHDLLDAYLCSWIAALEPTKRIALGQPPDDAIWVPKISRGESEEPFQATRSGPNHVHPAVPLLHAASRLCPACQTHEFRRWPFGWDSHAAHRCAGLTATDPEARKAEFKCRFR